MCPPSMNDASPAVADRAASFADLGLPPALVGALDDLGYETPTPVQASTIPPLLGGRDLVGHAPTGTGKTAAFALPLLARLAGLVGTGAGADGAGRDAPDRPAGGVRVLVLTPTRELAMQVAASFERYAAKLGGVRTLAIYGGQEYGNQIRALARGVQVVVGTPGRVMDHMRRGTLTLDRLEALVLDEGDEMLRMGFIDDVEWVLERTPGTRQVALFSATMPPQVRRIAQRHLKRPEEISIRGESGTAAAIRQRVWMVNAPQKLDALTRILEVEPFDAVLVFVRTKSATVELAEKLTALGHSAAAINGDMAQKQREQMVERLKRNRLDILVATDVVARGLDVDRISTVVNYDVPYDTEAYVHRIGRTGRAGRTGEAILFVTPRERGLLGNIERATRQKIEPLAMPTVEQVNERRVADFLGRIETVLEREDLGFLERTLDAWREERQVSPGRMAAALARLAIGDRPLLLAQDPRAAKKAAERERGKRRERGGARRARERTGRRRPASGQSRQDARPGRSDGARSSRAGRGRSRAAAALQRRRRAGARGRGRAARCLAAARRHRDGALPRRGGQRARRGGRQPGRGHRLGGRHRGRLDRAHRHPRRSQRRGAAHRHAQVPAQAAAPGLGLRPEARDRASGRRGRRSPARRGGGEPRARRPDRGAARRARRKQGRQSVRRVVEARARAVRRSRVEGQGQGRARTQARRRASEARLPGPRRRLSRRGRTALSARRRSPRARSPAPPRAPRGRPPPARARRRPR